MTRSFRTLFVITVALGLSADAFAHHSTTYYSKEQKDFVKIAGKVVRWEYRSPHSQLYVETTDKDGKVVTWRFESTPAAWSSLRGSRFRGSCSRGSAKSRRLTAPRFCRSDQPQHPTGGNRKHINLFVRGQPGTEGRDAHHP